LNTFGMRSIGTRPRRVSPEKWGIKKHPKDSLTEEIFVAAPREGVRKLDRVISDMTPNSVGAEDLSHVEDISLPTANTKLRGLGDLRGWDNSWLEVVLNNRGKVDVLPAFIKYAGSLKAQVDVVRSRNVGGLTFV